MSVTGATLAALAVKGLAMLASPAATTNTAAATAGNQQEQRQMDNSHHHQLGVEGVLCPLPRPEHTARAK
jgi:hypothetical protein